MSKNGDVSKTLKKKLKKLKKLEAEIAALKIKAAAETKPAKAGKKDAAGKDSKKDKKAAKSAKDENKAGKIKAGKNKAGKIKAGKNKAARKRDGQASPETAIKPATPSLVRSEPVKPAVKEATSNSPAPSARVAAG